MTTTLLRIIKYGLQSFRRNGLLSVATIVVMVLALMVFEGLIIFGVLTRSAIDSLENKIDISVYFKTTAPEDEILKIRKTLEELSEVKSVEYISRDKALEIFKEQHKDDPTITQALKELEDNPLLASLNIKDHDPNDYEAVASGLEAENLKNLIDKITFAESQRYIERLAAIVGTVEKLGFTLTVFLALTAALVTFNTIRLAIYSNREEIGIMRLVGASNVFINGPYIVEAIIFGILAAILSLAIAAPLVNLASPPIQEFMELNLKSYFYGNLFGLFGYLLIFGIGLGIVSATIAVRKYLKI